jgi:DNA-binding transcriptional ArsR family regulator
MDVTPKQQAVLDQLPATRDDIASKLDISYRAVRYRMEKMEDKHGMKFERDGNNVWSVSNEEPYEVREEEEPMRVKSHNKAQLTKDINDSLTELEKEVKEVLNNTDPVVNDYERTSGSSTLVLPHSDSHIGAVVQDRVDVDFYSSDEAEDSIIEYFDRGIHASRERGDVEDVVVIMNGDHLDGEGIYPSQRHEQDDNLRDQLKKGGRIYIEQFLKLSEEFESVSVYCVPGNHGRLDHESTTNADDMLYDFIESGLHYSPADNIHMERAGPAGFKIFDIRGWKYFCRHGQNFLQHVGTSSGIRKAQDWWMTHQYDVGIRSHYHTVLYETIGEDVPVIMTGSPAPASTFAEKRGGAGGRTGVFWFTTDKQRIEDFQPIRLKS